MRSPSRRGIGQSERVEPGHAPKRDTVMRVLDDVLAGRMSRDAASRWAVQWVSQRDPQIDDARVWDALTKIAMIDAHHGDEVRTLLFSDEQLADWREALR
jgi:hypothetical protein